jgi:hypothetical protein
MNDMGVRYEAFELDGVLCEEETEESPMYGDDQQPLSDGW